MNAPALFGAVGIGLSLGLTGAGGSILTLPVLVYLAGVPPREAVALSLLVVGGAALAGAIQRARAGDVHGRAALMFMASGVIGAFLGSRLTHLLPPAALMLTFAVLMVIVGLRMLTAASPASPPAPDCRPPRCLAAGGAVGVLTGFLGVGGGFLLVPALARFAKLPMRSATGTSLAIIACNSAAGFVSHMRLGKIDWATGIVFSAIAIVGALLGGKAAGRLPEKTMRRGFAVLVLATAAIVVWRSRQ